MNRRKISSLSFLKHTSINGYLPRINSEWVVAVGPPKTIIVSGDILFSCSANKIEVIKLVLKTVKPITLAL